ncbi:hypothetical protein [Granulicella paludicola]|uniref:hypothetical protein n=1 Tax=Granulicella paludicola TaxID=474951 RepID=UPI0021E02C9A|nr:hypothetical protein [Granulicella paludicola]
MIEPYRSDFNARFTSEKYEDLKRVMNERTRTQIEFRVAETPCFFPPELLQSMVTAGAELTHQLLDNPEYMQSSLDAIPAEYRVPNDDTHPHFMTVDFGLVRNEAGELEPRLVEMQAFPSLFGYQPLFAQAFKDVFALDPRLEYRFSGLDDVAYWSLMREVIVGKHAAENVVLAEIAPETQKTLPDFRIYEDRLGVRTVDVAKLIKRDRQLFYRNESDEVVRIDRIFNRVIVDELIRKKVKLPFDYRDDLDVEWAGHPNWYFRISKLSIPYLRHATVPPAVFLDDWFAGKGHDQLPEDPNQWVLKPLYSFAGKGIQFGPTQDDLDAIEVTERHSYLLQKRVQFANTIRTPEGLTQPEIRILYAWPEEGELTAMTSLIRLGRGLMMGVDHNRDKSWVGSSAGLYVSGDRQIHV